MVNWEKKYKDLEIKYDRIKTQKSYFLGAVLFGMLIIDIVALIWFIDFLSYPRLHSSTPLVIDSNYSQLASEGKLTFWALSIAIITILIAFNRWIIKKTKDES